MNLITNAYCFAMDQSGCRMLQKRLEQPEKEKFHARLLADTTGYFHELMMNNFGNYLCQKVIEMCSTAQLKTLLTSLFPFMPTVCLNNHGTRAVQAIIDSVRGHEDLIALFLQSIQGYMLAIILDVHGNHVI